MTQQTTIEKLPIPEYGNSRRFEINFKFELYSLISAPSDDIYVVVGYRENEYILLGEIELKKNSEGDFQTELSKVVNLEAVSKDFVEAEFLKVDHGFEQTSLCKVKVGDTVICIARNRYQGVSFGEILVVTSMPENRLSLSKKSVATYESKYFMVIKRPAINMTRSLQSLIDYKRSIHGIKVGSDCSSSLIDRSSLIVNLTHKKNHIRMLEVEGIIERPRNVGFDRIRPIFKPELIEKQK